MIINAPAGTAVALPALNPGRGPEQRPDLARLAYLHPGRGPGRGRALPVVRVAAARPGCRTPPGPARFPVKVHVFTYVNTAGGSGSYAATLNTNTGDYNRFGLYATFATAGTGNIATGNIATNCFNVTCTAAATAGPDHLGARPPHHVPSRPAAPARPAAVTMNGT